MSENNDVAKRGLEIYGSSKAVHIGLTDIVTEGQWKYSSTGTSIQIENWLSGQPNNINGGQQCAYMWIQNGNTNGQWGDITCTTFSTSFICEFL
jgi:hypothetical protein